MVSTVLEAGALPRARSANRVFADIGGALGYDAAERALACGLSLDEAARAACAAWEDNASLTFAPEGVG